MQSKTLCAFLLLALATSCTFQSVQSQDLLTINPDGTISINYGALTAVLVPLIRNKAAQIRAEGIQGAIDQGQKTGDKINSLSKEELEGLKVNLLGSLSDIGKYLKQDDAAAKEVRDLVGEWLEAVSGFFSGNNLLQRTSDIMKEDVDMRKLIEAVIEQISKLQILA